MSLMTIVPLIIFACVAISFFSGNGWPCVMYKLASAGIGLMGIGLIIGLVYGFAKRSKTQTTRQKVFHWLMTVCALAAVVFIVYSEAYAFWML